MSKLGDGEVKIINFYTEAFFYYGRWWVEPYRDNLH